MRKTHHKTDLKIKLLLVLYLWPVCACVRRVFFSQALVSVKGPPHPAPGSLLVQSVSAVGWCLLDWQHTDYSSHQACTDICCVFYLVVEALEVSGQNCPDAVHLL